MVKIKSCVRRVRVDEKKVSFKLVAGDLLAAIYNTHSCLLRTPAFVRYRRLRKRLEFQTDISNGIESLLISTARGQMVNTSLFDCDYYAWQDKSMTAEERFEGEFLSEYSWGESILADIVFSEQN